MCIGASRRVIVLSPPRREGFLLVAAQREITQSRSSDERTWEDEHATLKLSLARSGARAALAGVGQAVARPLATSHCD